jgi:hypothetical protein
MHDTMHDTTNRQTSWQPSKDEVARIREELRPLLSEMARRETVALREIQWRSHLIAS